MKKLNGMPYELQCEWSLSSDSILDIALVFIDYRKWEKVNKNTYRFKVTINEIKANASIIRFDLVNEEICTGDLRLPGAHKIGERPRLIGIYEATLVPFCSLISQIPPEGFHALELILLKHLLSGCFWRSLLSSDIWCFIGRWGYDRTNK